MIPGSKIGVFDSGSGGLTVLAALLDRLPGERFVYLGDHARAPYGGRPADEVFDLTRGQVEGLFQRGCRLVILACNTAAAVALRRLQQEWLPRAYPDRRVLGVLVPMVEAVTEVPFNGGHTRASAPALNVGVFATRRTVESGAYRAEIERRAPAISVIQQACPDLAGRIESGAPPREIQRMVAAYAEELCARTPEGRPDAVILGCTHYPLVEDIFAGCLPPEVRILSQPALVAESLVAYLARHPEFSHPQRGVDRVELLTTGEGPKAAAAARRFLGRRLLAGRMGDRDIGFREVRNSGEREAGGGPCYVKQRQAG